MYVRDLPKIKLKWNIKKYSNNPERAWKGKEQNTTRTENGY